MSKEKVLDKTQKSVYLVTEEQAKALLTSKQEEKFSEVVKNPALHGSRVLGPAVVAKLAKMQNKAKRGGRKGKGYRPAEGHSVGFTFDRMLPSEMDTKMCYFYKVSGVGGSAGYYFNYQSNALYDPNPGVGGQSFQPFAEWSTLYERYRVISYDWEVDIVNYHDTDGLNCYVLNTNLNPGAIVPSSNETAGFRSMNPYCAYGITGKATGDHNHVHLKGHCPIAGITGSRAFETDDTYSGTSSTNPTNLTWITVAIETVTGNNLSTSGAQITLRIVAKTRWYERINQYNS